MPTSRYSGCVIDDTTAEALSEFRKSLEEARVDALQEIEELDSLLQEFSSDKQKATIVIGDSAEDNELRWTAIEEGEEGNSIVIFYDYLGPIWNGTSFDPRPPSSYVDQDNPTHVHCILAVDANANVDAAYPVALCRVEWLQDLDVQALVDAELIGTGADRKSVV